MRNQIQMAVLKDLLNTHTAAQAFAAAAEAVKTAESELDYAYDTWKRQNRVHDFVERGSVTWKSMMLGTEIYYRALVNAKARKRRAEKKLIAAVVG